MKVLLCLLSLFLKVKCNFNLQHTNFVPYEESIVSVAPKYSCRCSLLLFVLNFRHFLVCRQWDKGTEARKP